MDISVSIHKRILVFFAIEILKFKRGFTSALCEEMISQNRQIAMNCEIMHILIYHWWKQFMNCEIMHILIYHWWKQFMNCEIMYILIYHWWNQFTKALRA